MARTAQPFSEVSRLMLATGSPLSRDEVVGAIDAHDREDAARLGVLWAYYRNPMRRGGEAGSDRRYRLAQERGLPARLLGPVDRSSPGVRALLDDRTPRREIVIENDIAWRVQTMVDFMFGRPLTIASTATAPERRKQIESALAEVWDASGGIALLQDVGLMGHVYGHVDLLVRVAPLHARADAAAAWTEPGTTNNQDPAQPLGDGGSSQDATPRERTEPGDGGVGTPGPAPIPERASNRVRLELIEPPRGVALMSRQDYRTLDAYIVRSRPVSTQEAAKGAGIGATMLRWLRPVEQRTARVETPDEIMTTEVFAGGLRQVYAATASGQTRLVLEEPTMGEARPGDEPPIVHIQNISQPFEYSGVGEVEPLIPLQDELNTRLSDRANRVTIQSFKMYLAKGLDGASPVPVAPGVVWKSDNPDAEIAEFGGDGASPSEERHIEEIREAMDKASAVPPLASGVVRAKIGNLSSENALRITLLGLMSKTNRKRITYGRGIIAASRLVLEALDRLGVLHTSPEERGLRIDWADPIPRDEQLALLAAQKKVELGVPREQVLGELGY